MKRLNYLRAMLPRWWGWIVGVYAAAGAYDLAHGQLLPEDWPRFADIVGRVSWEMWVVGGLALVIALLLEGGYKLARHQEETMARVVAQVAKPSPTPRLVCSGFLLDQRPVQIPDPKELDIGPTGTAMNAAFDIISSQPDAFVQMEILKIHSFIHLVFKNDPETSGKEATATGVRAELCFQDIATGRPLPGLTMSARWSETHQPTSAFDSRATRDWTIDMLGNGEPHELDIAVRDNDNGAWFVFNTSVYFAPRWGFREDWRLPEDVNVAVNLRGENVRQSWLFGLRELKGSGMPELVRLEGNFGPEA